MKLPTFLRCESEVILSQSESSRTTRHSIVHCVYCVLICLGYILSRQSIHQLACAHIFVRVSHLREECINPVRQNPNM